MSQNYEEQLDAAKKFVRSVNPSLSESILERTAVKVVQALPKHIRKSIIPKTNNGDVGGLA